MHSCGDCILLAGGCESLEQFTGIGHERQPTRRDRRGLRARTEQRFEFELAAVLWRDGTGGHHVDCLQAAGDHVVLRHRVTAERKHRDVRGGRLPLAHRHRERVRQVTDHLLRVVGDAPGREQWCQVRATIAAHAAHRVRGPLRFGDRIDEREQLAATHDELVDRVERGRRKVLRVHQQQHADVRVDRLRVAGNRTDVEQLARLLDRRPALAHLARHLVERCVDRQRREQPHDGLLRMGEPVDQARDVVFEELLLVRLEEADRLAAVGRVGPRQPEIQRLAVGADGDRGEAEIGRTVLVLGEGLRVDHGEPELAVRALRHLLEELAYALRVGAQRRGRAARFLGQEEIQVHRLGERAHDALGARRDRVQAAGGQVEPRAAEREGHNDRQGEKRRGQRDERAGTPRFPGTCAHQQGLNPLFSCRARSRWPRARPQSARRRTPDRAGRSRPS